jgi:lysophospholipase L1-like esterase
VGEGRAWYRRPWRRLHARLPRRRLTRILAVAAVVLLAAAIVVPLGLSGGGRFTGTLPKPPTTRPLTPLEAATRGGYAALGDSYSSGEGAYTGATDGTERGAQRCHRSPQAYYKAVGASFTFRGSVAQTACAGATVAGVRNGQYGQPSQLTTLGPGTTLVTLSVGGNDAGFSTVLTNCVVRVPFSAACRAQNSVVDGKLPRIKSDVTALLGEINRRSPAARIIMIGYPRLFPEGPTATAATIGTTDQRWLNAMARRLDDTLEAAARGVDQRIDRSNGPGSVEFVDDYTAFAGHEVGTPAPYINGLDLDIRHLKARPASFHPNITGYRRLAQLVDQQVRKGPGRPIHQYVLNAAR